MRRKLLSCFILPALLSCNHIETGSSLNKSDIAYIKSLGLLSPGETIYKFYSEFKNNIAGNFFTGKRIAKYWTDHKNPGSNEISYAFYPDIKSIDTVYYAGIAHAPYMLVIKKDNTQFKVSVDGSKQAIKIFFEDALRQWQIHRQQH